MYLNKYLKYKIKYLKYKNTINQIGGVDDLLIYRDIHDNIIEINVGNIINENSILNKDQIREIISFPDNLQSIGAGAFFSCTGLTTLPAFPDNLQSIGAFAFLNCTDLTGLLAFPHDLRSIGNLAFSGCIGLTGLLFLKIYV